MAVLFAILPSVGAFAVFWFAIRAVVESDRRERAAQARYERDGIPEPGPEGASGTG
ncbi:MAG: hypothetical protein P8Z68_09955 [Kineosporiaceae bacterium]